MDSKVANRAARVMRVGWVMGSNDYSIMSVGSRMGRWWPTLGLAIRVLFVGAVFSIVLGLEASEYLAWLASGWAVWGMISNSLTGTAFSMIASSGIMLAIPIPKEAFVLRVIVKEFRLLAQNSLLVLLIALLTASQIGFELLLLIPGLFLTAVFLYGFGLIFAPLVSKYRDLGPLISSIVGVMFFVLPIMWKPERIDSELAHLILGLNPLYHFLQIVRLPLLSEVPTVVNYLLAAAGALVSIVLGTFVMRRTRHKIVYWVK